ncbi:MAG: hypothetical protein ACYTF0_05100 [Planctomycetota bacterium]|jgi:hypothetical protein
MVRILTLACLCLSLLPAADGYAWPLNEPDYYVYQLEQDCRWRSADDDLAYRTTMRWGVALTAIAEDANSQTLRVEIVSITARHHGPGIDISYDSSANNDSPELLGDLHALVGHPLDLTVDRTSGAVRAVHGQQAIIDALIAANPAPPGRPSPMAAEANAAYSEARLASLWSQILARPHTATTSEDLAPPLSGQVERSWDGDSYRLGLSGSDAVTATLGTAPTALTLTVHSLNGSGRCQHRDGQLLISDGQVQAEIGGELTSQPLTMTMTFDWSFSRFDGLDAEAPEDDSPITSDEP